MAKRGRTKKQSPDNNCNLITTLNEKTTDEKDEYIKGLEEAISHYLSSIIDLEKKVKTLEAEKGIKPKEVIVHSVPIQSQPISITKTKSDRIVPRKLFEALRAVAKVRYQPEIIHRVIEKYYEL